jgi:hypothetical protein
MQMNTLDLTLAIIMAMAVIGKVLCLVSVLVTFKKPSNMKVFFDAMRTGYMVALDTFTASKLNQTGLGFVITLPVLFYFGLMATSVAVVIDVVLAVVPPVIYSAVRKIMA